MRNRKFNMKEIWRDVVGYEGIYSVSNIGRVRRDKKANGATVGKILKAHLNIDGYPTISLVKYKLGKNTRVHKLVAGAFIGIRPDDLVVNHIDGVKANNNVNNLEYVTRSENIRHAIRLGLKKPSVGESQGLSKLKEKDVIEIRRLHKLGNIVHSELAKVFNVSYSAISQVLSRKTWKHI